MGRAFDKVFGRDRERSNRSLEENAAELEETETGTAKAKREVKAAEPETPEPHPREGKAERTIEGLLNRGGKRLKEAAKRAKEFEEKSGIKMAPLHKDYEK